jgi:hypothetical protein
LAYADKDSIRDALREKEVLELTRAVKGLTHLLETRKA